MIKIKRVTYSNYLEDHYSSEHDELKYPMLNHMSAVDITMAAGRDYGFGDKAIFGLILENDWYIAFSMDDEDLSVQSAIIYDVDDTIIYRSEVDWLNIMNQPINMVARLTTFYNNYAHVFNTCLIENEEEFIYNQKKENSDKTNDLIKAFISANN